MVGNSTEITPGYDIFFTVRNLDKLFREYEVENLPGLLNKIIKSGWKINDYVNVLYYGLLKQHPTITKEEVLDIIEDYQTSKNKSIGEVQDLIYESFTDGGMYDRSAFEALKEAKSFSPERKEAFLKILLNKKSDPEKGEDKGE